MDEYNIPINNTLRSDEFSNGDMNKTLDLFKDIMGTVFKRNIHLEKELITGIFRIGKDSIFSDLNNINEFTKHYGFYQEELNSLFAEYGVSSKSSRGLVQWIQSRRSAHL